MITKEVALALHHSHVETDENDPPTTTEKMDRKIDRLKPAVIAVVDERWIEREPVPVSPLNKI